MNKAGISSLLITLLLNYSLPTFGMQSTEDASTHRQIIFLNGTTSAGKSSIAYELKKSLEQKNFDVEIIAIDTYVIKKVKWALGKGYVSYINPLNWGTPIRDLITSEKMKSIIDQSQKELCDATNRACQEGKIVIVDTVMIEQDHIQSYRESFKVLNVAWVLVCCPLAILIDRIIERNKSTDNTTWRSMIQTLNQYNLMYSPNTPHPLYKLDREAFIAMFQKAQEAHFENQETTPYYLKGIQNATCPFDFDTIQESMRTNFWLDDNPETTIGPVTKYSCIVNTEQNNAFDCAKIIMENLGL